MSTPQEEFDEAYKQFAKRHQIKCLVCGETVNKEDIVCVYCSDIARDDAYHKGIQEGHDTGYQEGYKQGYNEGVEVGMEEGKSEGLRMAEDRVMRSYDMSYEEKERIRGRIRGHYW